MKYSVLKTKIPGSVLDFIYFDEKLNRFMSKPDMPFVHKKIIAAHLGFNLIGEDGDFEDIVLIKLEND